MPEIKKRTATTGEFVVVVGTEGPSWWQKKGPRIRRAAIVLALLGAAAYFGSRPAWRLVKAFRARQFAQQAETALAEGKFSEAAGLAGSGWNLSRTEPAALRAMANVLTLAERPVEALTFWKEVEAKGPLTPTEQRKVIRCALRTRDFQSAENRLALLRQNGVPAEAMDSLASAEASAQRGDWDRARVETSRLLAADGSGPELRGGAALILASSPDPNDRFRGLRELETIALTTHPFALVAATWLATNPAYANATGRTPEDFFRLAKQLADHPSARLEHRLLALEMRLRAEPGEKADVLARAAALLPKPALEPDRARLIRWLMRQGDLERATTLLPNPSSIQTPELFLVRLDLLAAQKRWAEVRSVLERDQSPLEPRLRHAFLARALTQLGDRRASGVEWDRAVTAAGRDASGLVEIMKYAEASGALDVAADAASQAAKVAPEIRATQDETLAFLVRRGTTKDLRAQIRKMIERWPDDTALINDEAYLTALLNDDVARAAPVAERLSRGNPWSYPFRTTLALVRLRQGRAVEALAVYEGGVAPDGQPNSARVVRAAVLRANGYRDEARQETTLVTARALRTEEKELLAEATR